MNTTGPRSLRDIVAAGDNPLDHLAPGDNVAHLIDELQAACRVPICGTAPEAVTTREMFEHLTTERTTTLRWGDGRTFSEEADPAGFARVLQHFLWRAELLEDPALIDQAVELLPAAERLAVGVAVTMARQPHPLEIDTIDGWDTCNGCGAHLAPGTRVLTVGTKPDYSEAEDIESLVWCRTCAEAAVAGFEG